MSTTTKSATQTAGLYSLERARELSAATTSRQSLEAVDGRAVAVDASSATRSVTQIDQLARLAYTRAAPSTDARYVKFVEAVRALRVDLDLSTLSRAQIDRILESAQRLYLINDGLPEPVEPPPIEPDFQPELPLTAFLSAQEDDPPAGQPGPGSSTPDTDVPAGIADTTAVAADHAIAAEDAQSSAETEMETAVKADPERPQGQVDQEARSAGSNQSAVTATGENPRSGESTAT